MVAGNVHGTFFNRWQASPRQRVRVQWIPTAPVIIVVVGVAVTVGITTTAAAVGWITTLVTAVAVH